MLPVPMAGTPIDAFAVVTLINVIRTGSSSSGVVSPIMVIIMSALWLPAGIVSVPDGMIKSLPAVAVLPTVL